MRIVFLVILSSIVFLSSCSRQQAVEEQPGEAGTYFSVMQFAKDQFDSFWGQPFTLHKIVTLNGKTDSSIVSIFKLEWGSVLKPFFDSDISNPKLTGQYNFSTFEDNTTDSRIFYYEAKDKKLFTRSLQISADPLTSKVKSIYIETQKNGMTRKLLYKPVKLIQIQEYESSIMGGKRDLRVEYRFL